MASDTPLNIRSLVIYQIFPRNYGPTGTLKDITADLDRLVAIGADVLHLLPIYPIGVQGRKGSLGSPYAIREGASPKVAKKCWTTISLESKKRPCNGRS